MTSTLPYHRPPVTSTHHNAQLEQSPKTTSSTLPDYSNSLPFDYLDSLDFANASQRSSIDQGAVNSNHVDDWASASNPDSMQSDTWAPLAQQFTSNLGRFPHQRESSLSSLGSTGPASPFNHNTSNPHIAMSDSTSDGLADMQVHDNQGNSYYQLAKSLGPMSGYQNLDPAMPEMAYPVAIPGPHAQGVGANNSNKLARGDRSLLPVPDFANGQSRSQPGSVASSIVSDSPATPATGELENERRKKGHHNIPKLARTITDVYGDELYDPNFTITSASPSQPSLAVSPSRSNDLFNQRINAANSQHLSAAQSPVSTTPRAKSPFLSGSPHAPPSNDADVLAAQHGMQHQPQPQQQQAQQLSSAPRLTALDKNTQQMFQQQVNQRAEPATPKTISPQDAMLEFSEPDGDANFPLFPPESNGFGMDQLTKSMMPSMPTADLSQTGMVNPSGVGQGQFAYVPSQMPNEFQVPQTYPFIARPQPGHDTPPRLSSAGSSSADSGPNTPVSRPRKAGAEGGTYTCTYHGCTLRFETPAMLQKHKREGHRATQGIGNTRPIQELPGMTSSFLNSQAGPHRCDRRNPSTGKPCNTVFSRPYDLTRHEDTIHNARKQKVRCDLCTEEKTFSRADALTRHFRVCHPEMEPPGKHRRRAMIVTD